MTKRTELEEMTESAKVELTHTALGVYQGPDKLWYVAKLRFDPTTGQAQVTERFEAGEDRYFAGESFKIRCVDEELI